MFSRLITLLQFLRMRKRKKKKKPLCFNGGMGGIGKKRKEGMWVCSNSHRRNQGLSAPPSPNLKSPPKAGASGPPAPPMETGSPSPPPPPPSLNRRTRVRFSVAEETALLQAVEEFGTESWQEVKSRAFLNVDHRTPKDLSDKWKSLIRTAKLLPEKRRGVHLAQPLLDRVLAVQCKGSINPIPEMVASEETGVAAVSTSVLEGYNLYSLICLSDPSVLESLNAAGITKMVLYLWSVYKAADLKKDSVLRNLVEQMAGPDPTVEQCFGMCCDSSAAAGRMLRTIAHSCDYLGLTVAEVLGLRKSKILAMIEED